MKSELLWGIRQRMVIIPCRCFGTTYRSPSSRVKKSKKDLFALEDETDFLDFWPLQKGLIGCPVTSVSNYLHTLRNNLQEWRSQRIELFGLWAVHCLAEEGMDDNKYVSECMQIITVYLWCHKKTMSSIPRRSRNTPHHAPTISSCNNSSWMKMGCRRPIPFTLTFHLYPDMKPFFVSS